MNPAPEPLTDFLGVIVDHLKPYPIDRFRVTMDGEAVVDANWKTNIDAFLEFYHGYYIHPEITPMVETYRVQYDLYDRSISRMIIPFGYAPEKLADTETINEGLKQDRKSTRLHSSH